MPVAGLNIKINSSADDAEEYIWTEQNDVYRTDGSMDLTSSDIELGAEEQNGKNPQISGLRFTGINLPKNAQIRHAYIQFTVDAADKNEDPANYWIFAEDNVNPSAFMGTAYDITSREWYNDSVQWNVAEGSWNTAGEAGESEKTTDISMLVQHLVNQTDWAKGNPMTFFIKGTGVREAASFDGSEDGAARLIIDYLQGETTHIPELVKEIPDQELVQGWDLSLDLNPYFKDEDSELTITAMVTGTDTLPTGLTLSEGILSGIYNQTDSFSITVTASSDGDEVSDTFALEYIAPSGNFTLAIFHNNDGESDMLPDSITVNGKRTTGGSIGQFKATLDSLRKAMNPLCFPQATISLPVLNTMPVRQMAFIMMQLH